ncbi:hypothetical protein O6H91_Y246600 [Diphasiastrum complanatum]|nr:hypothetical protein O6H91_Y246600 [Diphasiastrum complanatum]
MRVVFAAGDGLASSARMKKLQLFFQFTTVSAFGFFSSNADLKLHHKYCLNRPSLCSFGKLRSPVFAPPVDSKLRRSFFAHLASWAVSLPSSTGGFCLNASVSSSHFF